MRATSVLKSLALTAVLALPVLGYAQGGERAGGVVSESIKSVSTVEKVDAETREVTLRREDGSLVTIVAGEDVRNFDQIRVGDIVETEVTGTLAIALESAHTKTRQRRDVYGGSRAPLGAKPGAQTIHTVEVLATVEDVDPETREVTVKGPRRTVVLEVAEDVDLSTIKKGDNVRAVYIETMSIRVRAPGKPSK